MSADAHAKLSIFRGGSPWQDLSHTLSCAGAKKLGHKVGDAPFFDTVRIDVSDADKIIAAAAAEGCNLRKLDGSTITISLDETTRMEDIDQLLKILNGGSPAKFSAESLASEVCCLSSEL